MSAANPSSRSIGGATGPVLRGAEFVPFHRTPHDEWWTLLDGDIVELHVIHADGHYEVRMLYAVEKVDAGCLRAARLAAGGRIARCSRYPVPTAGDSGPEFPAAAEILREHPLHECAVRALTCY